MATLGWLVVYGQASGGAAAKVVEVMVTGTDFTADSVLVINNQPVPTTLVVQGGREGDGLVGNFTATQRGEWPIQVRDPTTGDSNVGSFRLGN